MWGGWNELLVQSGGVCVCVCVCVYSLSREPCCKSLVFHVATLCFQLEAATAAPSHAHTVHVPIACTLVKDGLEGTAEALALLLLRRRTSHLHTISPHTS